MKPRPARDPQSRVGLTPGRLLAVLAVTAFTLNAAHAARDESLPYHLAVSVAYGTPRGPESLRDDLERDLTVFLAQSRCFESVERGTPREGPGLRLRVTLDEYAESVEYLTSLADRHSPMATPDVQNQMIAEVRARVDLSVSLADGEEVVRRRRFTQRSSLQPRPGADATHDARLALIEDILSTARSFMCKGSAAKWERDLARARAAMP